MNIQAPTEQEIIGRAIIALKETYPDKTPSQRADLVMSLEDPVQLYVSTNGKS